MKGQCYEIISEWLTVCEGRFGLMCSGHFSHHANSPNRLTLADRNE